eukprot:gene22580-9978_t
MRVQRTGPTVVAAFVLGFAVNRIFLSGNGNESGIVEQQRHELQRLHAQLEVAAVAGGVAAKHGPRAGRQQHRIPAANAEEGEEEEDDDDEKEHANRSEKVVKKTKKKTKHKANVVDGDRGGTNYAATETALLRVEMMQLRAEKDAILDVSVHERTALAAATEQIHDK